MTLKLHWEEIECEKKIVKQFLNPDWTAVHVFNVQRSFRLCLSFENGCSFWFDVAKQCKMKKGMDTGKWRKKLYFLVIIQKFHISTWIDCQVAVWWSLDEAISIN